MPRNFTAERSPTRTTPSRSAKPQSFLPLPIPSRFSSPGVARKNTLTEPSAFSSVKAKRKRSHESRNDEDSSELSSLPEEGEEDESDFPEENSSINGKKKIIVSRKKKKGRVVNEDDMNEDHEDQFLPVTLNSPPERIIQASSKFLSFYDFVSLFRASLGFPKFHISDLEAGLLLSPQALTSLDVSDMELPESRGASREGSVVSNTTGGAKDHTEKVVVLWNEFMARLVQCLIHGKTAVTPSTWQVSLRAILRRHNYAELFPDEYAYFEALPIYDKITILHLLGELVFESEAWEGKLGREMEADELRHEPLGNDSKGRAFWLFAESRLYREEPFHKLKKGVPGPIVNDLTFNLVAQTPDQWRTVMASLPTKSKSDRALAESIKSVGMEVIAKIEARELRIKAEVERQEKLKVLEAMPKKRSTRIEQKAKEREEQLRLEEIARQQAEAEAARIREQERLRKEEAHKTKEAVRINEKRLDHNLQSALSTFFHSHPPPGTLPNHRPRHATLNDVKNAELVRQLVDSEGESVVSGLPRVTPVSGWQNAREVLGEWEYKTGEANTRAFTQPLTQLLRLFHIQVLNTSQYGGLFALPVDPVALGIPDYPEVVKNPMDVSTVYQNLILGKYTNFIEWVEDLRLILKNCFLYNKEDTWVSEQGRNFEQEIGIALGRWFGDISTGNKDTQILPPGSLPPIHKVNLVFKNDTDMGLSLGDAENAEDVNMAVEDPDISDTPREGSGLVNAVAQLQVSRAQDDSPYSITHNSTFVTHASSHLPPSYLPRLLSMSQPTLPPPVIPTTHSPLLSHHSAMPDLSSESRNPVVPLSPVLPHMTSSQSTIFSPVLPHPPLQTIDYNHWKPADNSGWSNEPPKAPATKMDITAEMMHLTGMTTDEVHPTISTIPVSTAVPIVTKTNGSTAVPIVAKTNGETSYTELDATYPNSLESF